MNNTESLKKYFLNPISNLTPVDWAEKNRVLTKDITPWPGPMKYNRTPYLKEIANSIMAEDPSRVIVVMKGSQIGFSIGGIFTMMGWVISESPSNILFVVNDDEGLRRAMQGPVDQMINSSGISHLIKAQNIRGGRNQKTGDTIKGKSFPNGNLYTWSGQSIGKLGQISVKYGFYDEVERYKLADKDSGHFYSLIEKRHRAFKDTKKLYLISTPEIKQTSRIEPLYLKGDQRKFHIPCKKCGEMIPLEWSIDVEELNIKAGVTFDRNKDGSLNKGSVMYTCQKCGKKWPQTHVYDCYDDDLGKWLPTSIPVDEMYRSYHISALYAPAGMDDWVTLAQRWCEIHPIGGAVKIEELKTFINQDLGQTWEARGIEVETKMLMRNTRSYDIQVVPNALSQQDGNGSIVIVTCAIDLNGKEDDARLDYEILAWSETGSSYSIDHGSIGTFERSKAIRSGQSRKYAQEDEDRVKWTYQVNMPNNVWDEFERVVMGLKLISDDGSRSYQIVLHGLDTGHFTKHAYSFADRKQNVIKLKGKVDNKFTKHDGTKHFYTKSTKINKLYHVEGDLIKNELFQEMQLEWNEDIGVDQPDGYMNFPKPDGEKYMYKSYFREYEGEKMEAEMNDSGTAVGFRWVKKHSSSINHFWDCRVYNKCVKEIFTEMFCRAAKMPISWANLVAALKK